MPFIFLLVYASTSATIAVDILYAPKMMLQPFTPKYQSPCSEVADPDCVAGYPGLAATMRHEAATSTADATVLVAEFMQIDRIVQLHPSGLHVNDGLWVRLNITCTKMTEPYFLSWAERLDIARTILKAQVPIVATNLLLTQDWTVFQGVFHYHHIAEPISGVKIGLLFVYPEAFWFPNHGFGDSLRDYVTLLRELGASVVVVYVCTTAPESEIIHIPDSGADVALYYSTNTNKSQPMVQPSIKGNTWMVATELVSNHVQKLRLLLDSNMPTDGKVVLDASATLLDTTAVPDVAKQHPAYAQDQQYLQQLIDEATAVDKVLGQSAEDMPWGEWRTDEGKVAPCRHQECHLGTLVTEAMKNFRGDEIAFVNGGGLRKGWDKGPIKQSDLTGAVPFQNYICYINLTAAEIYRALEHSVSTVDSEGNYNRSESLTGQFLQVSGLRYSFNPKLPKNKRITGIKVPSAVKGEWKDIDPTRPYSVVTVKYLCDGGDDFDFSPHKGVSEDSTTDIWSLVSRRIQDLKTIQPALRGSVTMDKNETWGVIKLAENCTLYERYRSEWEICVDCPAGMYHPEVGDSACIAQPIILPGSSTDLVPILAPAIGGFVVVMIVLFVIYHFKRSADIAKKTRFAPKGGDVAFIFTDILKSSELWDAFPEEMTEALATHHKIARSLIERYQAYEIKTIGDAFMIALSDPVSAAEFLCHLQRELLVAQWPARLMTHAACKEETGLFRGLRVRAGCHLGPCNVVQTPGGGYDYDGGTVNLSARVSDSGGGGQVVITESVYQAIEDQLDSMDCFPDVKYIGEYRFKGIKDPVACYQLLPEELSAREFGPLRNAEIVENEVEAVAQQEEHHSKEMSVYSAASKLDNWDKRSYTQAMQTLRKWVILNEGKSIEMRHFSELLSTAVREEQVICDVIVTALMTLSTRSSTRTHHPERLPKEINIDTQSNRNSEGGHRNRIVPRTTSPRGSIASARRQSAYADTHERLKWPFICEVLKLLPKGCVVFLASKVKGKIYDGFLSEMDTTGLFMSDPLMQDEKSNPLH